jgi:hypothetical protein
MQQLNFTTYICLFTLHFLSGQENLFMMHEFVVPFSAFQELIYISLFEYFETDTFVDMCRRFETGGP